MYTTDMAFHNTLLNSSMGTIRAGKGLFPSMGVEVSEKCAFVVIQLPAEGASDPLASPPLCQSPPHVAILQQDKYHYRKFNQWRVLFYSKKCIHMIYRIYGMT